MVSKVGLDLVDSVDQLVFLDLPVLPEMRVIRASLVDRVCPVHQDLRALQDSVVGMETSGTLVILDSKVHRE